jgi:hypothetical protein
MKVFSALYLILMMFTGSFALADDGVIQLLPSDQQDSGLPSDLGPVSIEASRRALEAKVQDWSDDRADNKSRRVLACAMAQVEGVLIPVVGGSVAPLLVLSQLPAILAKTPQPGETPSVPLYTALNRLSKTVSLTTSEKNNVKRLMEREVTDKSDRIRLVIDTESFLMKVSSRLFQEQVDLHLARTQGFIGFFRYDMEYCQAYTLQAERDTELMKAAYRVLAYYNFLEQELAD